MKCTLIDDIGEDYLVFDFIIKHDKYGVKSVTIARELNLSVYKVRKSLRSLKIRGWITWFAQWYGCNEGYARLYRLSEKARKMENG